MQHQPKLDRGRSDSSAVSSNSANGANSTSDPMSLTNLDNLIHESEMFLSQISQISTDSAASNSDSSVLQAAKKFRQWRTRRRDEKLLLTMNSLLPRIKLSEEYLRDLIIQIVEKKLALRDQARHLKYRLDACIGYNSFYINSQEEVIDEMRNSVNALSTESTLVKAMVAFNVELVRQKVMETVRNNRTFVSWGSKAVLLRPISEQELSEDADHPALMTRLNAIRECREQLVARLSTLLETRETHMVNLENSSETHKTLCELLSAAGEDMNSFDSSSSSYGTKPFNAATAPSDNGGGGGGGGGNGGGGSKGGITFNHDQCHDCSYVQMITNDCITHLNLLTKQTVEASQRLLQLVELRERVRDSAELLHIEELDLTMYDDPSSSSSIAPPSAPSSSSSSASSSSTTLPQPPSSSSSSQGDSTK